MDADGKWQALTTVRTLPVVEGQKVINFYLDTASEAEEDHLVLANGFVTGDLFLQQRKAAGKK